MEDKLNVEEFEDLFGNTPFENIKKIRKYINENYIPKSKIKEILEQYKYTEIGDTENLIEFYKKLQRLLEKE